MSQNPYESPSFSQDPFVEATTAPPKQQIASQGKRFLNMIIDGIIVRIISGVAGFALGFSYAVIKVSGGGEITAEDETFLNMIGFALGLSIAIGYFVVMEGLFYRTIGKFVTGTVVVTPDGGRPTLGQVVGRTFARLIPFEAFSFLGGKFPVGWHDSLSKTRVMNVR